jgi:hypothetical protein
MFYLQPPISNGVRQGVGVLVGVLLGAGVKVFVGVLVGASV